MRWSGRWADVLTRYLRREGSLMPQRPPSHRPYPRAERRHRSARQQRKRRSSASARGYDRRWRKVRLMHLRENPLCVLCGARGRTVAATEVDHIIPLSEGGGEAGGNLQGLCKRCHGRKTAGARRGPRVGITGLRTGMDGAGEVTAAEQQAAGGGGAKSLRGKRCRPMVEPVRTFSRVLRGWQGP